MAQDSRPTVLLVEDEPAQREVLSYNLDAEGFRVVSADNGEDALMLVDEEAPDIIILDWMMPQLSGIEVCRRLKMRPETRAIPIIMPSARAEEVDRIRGLETGADDYGSPIAGKVIKQIMYSGEVTGPGNPIYAILSVGKGDWVIKAGLTDRDWARVNKNDKVKISLDAYPGQSYTGIISEKSSVGGNASGTFDVHVRFDQQPQNLAAGLIANLSIASDKEKYTVIPIESLIKSNGKTAFVFTADNGKAKLIKISIAKLLGDKVAVTSGLEGVTNVITIGAMYLEDGENIKY